jgi:hypothetical protein
MNSHINCPNCGMPTIPDKENLTLEEMLCEECHSKPPPQHTPGPWIVRGGNVIESFSNVNVAKAWMTDQKEECANANLIATAPDLLVALEQCVPLIIAHANCSGGEGVSTLQVARAAIARAKGKTK